MRTERPKSDLPPILLRPGIQHYPWGDPDFIPRLLGRKNPRRTPHAELWIGDHPVLPARAVVEGREVGLDRLMEEWGAEILGAEIAARFARLPFLLKVLAAARPLSIQVHPDRKQAEEGFRREEAAGIPLSAANRNYKDRNHKPELLVALTRFQALRGFRPLPEIAQVLEETPELRALGRGFTRRPASLRALHQRILGLSQEEVDAILSPLIARLRRNHRKKPFSDAEREYWVLLADEEFSVRGRRDRGLFSIYFLNLIELKPLQALTLPPGVIHAYLRGAGIEVMASSDNVLRWGLTGKFTDREEIIRTARFDGESPEILEAARSPDGSEWIYPSPASEFELRHLEVAPGTSRKSGPARGVEVLFVAAAGRGAQVAVSAGGTTLDCRPGAACLIPDGLQYVIEARGPATIFKVLVPSVPVDRVVEISAERPARSAAEPPPREPLFRGRRPVKLAFGTSGLRGLASDITDLEAFINTTGFLEYLLATADARRGGSVAIAGDLRPTTDGPERSILRAVARAAAAAGMSVVNLGRVPTPALAFHAFERRWPSIMVTGSHIPFDRNGIKFNKSTGEVLKDDEAAILMSVEEVRAREYGRPEDESLFGDDGMFRRAAPLPPVLQEAREGYLRRYLDFFPAGALSGKRIVVYEHSSVGREALAEILTGLGAELIPLGRSAEFVAIDTEAISADDLQRLQSLADEARARYGRIDALISADGDADRPLVLGIDRKGKAHFLGGDLLGVATAEYLAADCIAVPVSASDVVDLHFARHDLTPIRTRIGSPHVISALKDAPGSRKVGFEANGGFITGSDIEKDGRVLRALPTRDAALPILAVLHGAFERGRSLVDHFARLPRRFGRSGLIDAFPLDIARALVRVFSPRDGRVQSVVFEGGKAKLLDGAGRTVKGAGDAGEVLGLREGLERHFSRKRGFSRIERLNFLDGVRIHFAGGDIAHFRPSGNAPQMRIYAVAGTARRAERIVELALREPDGILRDFEREARKALFLDRIRRNIDFTRRLFEERRTPEVIGCVSGSEEARRFWQRELDAVREGFGAREAVSLVEDLPTNQAFGVLLLWQRLRERMREGRGALAAFVFGEGTRSTPFTETDNAQKPAIATFVREAAAGRARWLSMVELGLRYFVPVEQYLRRSGFDGLVIKWGDEVEIPTLDLSDRDPLFAGADVVRFVSIKAMTEDEAASKDWVGIDAAGRITAFIPRRPLKDMHMLADRGLLHREGGKLHGGINLGSIALSREFLDALLAEFAAEVNDPRADRSKRPDLDPQFFTALTVAAAGDPAERARSWKLALRESKAMRALDRNFPRILARLVGVLERLEKKRGRKIKMAAMDFGETWWGDIGQHRKIHEFYMALNDRGVDGEVARALAGIPSKRDARGNILAGDTVVGAGVEVRDSVLIDAVLTGRGVVERSVLVGTRAINIRAREAFDVLSTARELSLAPRAGSYKIVSAEKVTLRRGERATTLFLPGGEERLLRVHEDTDLRDRKQYYEIPILGNALSFRDAHRAMTQVSPEDLAVRRERRAREVLGRR